MILFKKAARLSEYISRHKSSGKKIGFVPTMGALHQGHLSLLKAALTSNDITVCSIFVNPTQFNDPSDYQKYPVTIEEDIRLLHESGAEVLFLPEVTEIYPNGLQHTKYDLGDLETVLEGKFRPRHFQGVCQVMQRLLEIVYPHNLYMGQKDYQQCLVVNRLIKILEIETALVTCPTLRENDGLAMSSRNVRLDAAERKKATAIYEALTFIRNNIAQGDVEHLTRTGAQMLQENGFRPDYVVIADAESLKQVDSWNGQEKIVALVAAFMKEVRLIDNLVLNE